jgi:hypothetical protein
VEDCTWVWSPTKQHQTFLSIAVEKIDGTGTAVQLVEKENSWGCHRVVWNWMPIVGAEPRALMVDVLLEFEEDGGDVAAESGGQD